MNKPVMIIPLYKHAEQLSALLSSLTNFNLPVIVVDDGNDELTRQRLESIITQFDFASLISLPKNQGKGGAVMAGFHEAIQRGFKHAIQIDADGQHDLADLPKFIDAIKQHPDAIIAGEPLYDESAPKARLYGRLITNFWVHIETLSKKIKDAMCGYRAYPLTQIQPLIENHRLTNRMNFDIEVLVRAAWANIPFIWIPTKVIYHEEGHSNFHLIRDNLQISWLHTQLVFGMLMRLPKLLLQKNHPVQHWSELKEKGSLWGLKFTLATYKLLGRSVTNFLLYFIIGYFYLFHRKTVQYSKKYLKHLAEFAKQNKPLSSFKHFLSFGEAALDKLAVWNGDITIDQIDFPNRAILKTMIDNKQGGVIFTAHLGNIDIARAMTQFIPGAKINAIVFQQHAVMFNSLIEKINPAFKMNLIEATTIDMPLAIQLKEKIDAGELIVIVADRTSTTQPERTIPTTFLNYPTALPQGPFILAGLLQCPTYFMICTKEPVGRFNIIFEPFETKIDLTKSNRDTNLAYYAKKYCQRLETYCQHYPLQWFNFFDFYINLR